jgi:hypothetical protein
LSRILKVLGSIFAAIVLGAIGSGVWEKLLSPAISRLSDATAALISSMSSNYEDSIYQRAARDTTDLYSIKIAFLIILAIGLTLVISIALRVLARASIHQRIQRMLNLLLGAQGLMGGLALVVLAFISMAKVDTASRIKESSLRSLEILRPQMGDSEYFQMRSQYYSIEDKRDFEAFKTLVLEKARKASRKVPIQHLEH